MKILLAGYFGCGNLGDDAILEAMLVGLKEQMPEAAITVLSGNISETNECYSIASVSRTNILDVIRAIRACDAFILGGGGLIQDITSSRSIYYYLSLIFLAKLFRKKVVLIGQSIGPVKSGLNRFLMKIALRNIDLLTVRDASSLEQIKNSRIKVDNICLTSDLSFTLKIPADEQIKKLLEIEGIKQCKEHLIGVSLRKSFSGDEDIWSLILAQALDKLSDKDCQIVFLVFHYPDDIEITKKVLRQMKNPAHIIFRRCKPTDMLGIISKLDLLIGMRLHSVLFSSLTTTPMIGLSYDPKVSGFLSSIKFPYTEISNIKGEELVSSVNKTLGALQMNRNALSAELPGLKNKAEMNFRLVKEALFDPRIRILGVGIDNITIEEASYRISGFIKSGKPHLVTSANPEIILEAQNDMGLTSILNDSSIALPDGSGVVLAAKLNGKRFKQRVTGIDLMNELLELSSENGYKVFFLGGREGVADKAADNIKRKFPDLNIVGAYHGFFKNDRIALDLVKKASPDILFVGMGSPRQEKWSSRFLKELNVPVVMTVGGSFDVLSGNIKRAPMWMQRVGMEWLYRLIREPRRIFRIMKLPVFLYRAIKS